MSRGQLRNLLFSAFIPLLFSSYQTGASSDLQENVTKEKEKTIPDKITEVEATPTQLIIHTTKDGGWL